MNRLRLRLAVVHDRGASAVEYALLIAAIGAVIIGVAFTLGGRVRSAITSTSNCVAAHGVGCASSSATPTAAPTRPPTPTPSPSSTRGSGSGSGSNGNGHNGNNGSGNGNGNNDDD